MSLETALPPKPKVKLDKLKLRTLTELDEKIDEKIGKGFNN